MGFDSSTADTTPMDVSSFKRNLGPIIAGIVASLTPFSPQDEQPTSWAVRLSSVSAPNQIDPLAKKMFKLTALLDIATPGEPPVTSAIKSQSGFRFKAIDERQLLLQGERFTCISQVQGIIIDAADAIKDYAKTLSSQTLAYKANIVAEQLNTFTHNPDNTWLLSNIDVRLSSAQAQYQRAA